MLTLEEQKILQENNQMLKKICDWIDKHESNGYQNNEDMKNMLINLVTNTLTNMRR